MCSSDLPEMQPTVQEVTIPTHPEREGMLSLGHREPMIGLRPEREGMFRLHPEREGTIPTHPEATIQLRPEREGAILLVHQEPLILMYERGQPDPM